MTDTLENTKLDQSLLPIADKDITPQHRTWMNAEIKKALDHKQSGQATYKTLNEIRQKFGF
jgi:hypothetical protein